MTWIDSQSAGSFNILAELLNAPVFVFRKDSLVKTYGKVPYFQEVLYRKNLPVTPHGNNVKSCAFAKCVLDEYVFLMGPFRSGLSPTDDELKEPFEVLPVFNPSFNKMLEFAAKSVCSVGSLELDYSSTIKRQQLVLDFLHHLGNPKDVSLLVRKTAEFFVQKFRLSNAVVSALDSVHRYFPSRRFAKEYAEVESVLVKLLSDSKAAIKIDNVASDFMLKGVEGLDNLPNGVVGYPLVHDRVFIGYVLLYSDEFKDVDLIPDLVNELVRVLLSAGDFERVRTSARIDSLTGLYNRNYFVPSANVMIADLRKRNAPISVILFDVDNFKKFNDTFGHPKGDVVLKSLGGIVLDMLPRDALCCRYGGEEFVIAMHVDQNVAQDFSEKLRSRVENGCDLTISVGVMTCLNSSANFSDLIREADRALYRAKDMGKNRVVPFVMVDKNLGVVDTTNV